MTKAIQKYSQDNEMITLLSDAIAMALIQM